MTQPQSEETTLEDYRRAAMDAVNELSHKYNKLRQATEVGCPPDDICRANFMRIISRQLSENAYILSEGWEHFTRD